LASLAGPDVVMAVAVALTDAAGSPALPPSHDAALNIIRCIPDVSVTELASALGLSHSAAVRVADRLQQARLVERNASGPGRRVSLRLTAPGRAAAAAAATRRAALIDRALSALGAAERARFLADMGRVAGALALTGSQAERACRLCDQPACRLAGCPLPWDTAL
jgi:DNA-binding MarR family transcriptional regulator